MKRLLLLFSVLALTSCAYRAPLIGISGSYASEGVGSTTLNTNYSQAISKAGGVPVVIPTLSSREEADAVLAKLDGIVFSGDEDLDPSFYGEEKLNATVFVDTVRDVSDVFLAKSALASKKPILAICRGEQLMNVVLGGSLYQDLAEQMPENVGHSGTTHKILAEPGSLLAKLYGTDSLEVNSSHHQAVKDVAPGLKVTAYSDDGIVEAYEGDNLIAVQFHPEKLVRAGDNKWLEIFKVFIKKARH